MKDSYEVTLRSIMRTFLSLEMFLVCWIAVGVDLTLLQYHKKALEDVLYVPACICFVFIGGVLLSCYFKGFYVFEESLHLVTGEILILIGFFSGSVVMLLNAFLIVVVLSVRMVVYKAVLHRQNRKNGFLKTEKSPSENPCADSDQGNSVL